MKQQALNKMLNELKGNKDRSIDVIHNYLCDQDDEELFQGILKEGKSLKGSLDYCRTLAHKQAQYGMAVIEDKTVFEWVITYFKDDTIQASSRPKQDDTDDDEEVSEVNNLSEKAKNFKPTRRKKETQQAKGQINLWDVL